VTPGAKLAILAAAFAARAHAGQVDRQGVAYIEHVAAVASLTRIAGGTWTQVTAAWLHDVLEDTPVTAAELREVFPAEVVDIVEALTRPADVTYLDWVRSLVGTDAALVKYADLTHNTDTERGPVPAGLVDRYAQAKQILAPDVSQDLLH
jgi:(p)ppGpp synthase/HD superfamily hydrolase